MAYIDNFVSVNHKFLVDRRYTAAEKTVLIWLASKPEDWDVKQEQIQAELGIGRNAVKAILRDLRSKGAITKPASERQRDGTYRRPPGRLAIRGEIRRHNRRSHRRTEGPYVGPSVLSTKEGPNKESVTNEGRPQAVPSVNDASEDPWTSPLPGSTSVAGRTRPYVSGGATAHSEETSHSDDHANTDAHYCASCNNWEPSCEGGNCPNAGRKRLA